MELHGSQITWIGTFVSINFYFRFLSVASIHVSQVMLPHFLIDDQSPFPSSFCPGSSHSPSPRLLHIPLHRAILNV